MTRRMSFMSFLVLFALLATSCTRSGTIEMTTDAGATGGDAAPVADPAGSDSSAADGVVGEVEGFISSRAMSMAESLVEQYGSEDAALDALFLSMDKGYSTSQILQALSDSSLHSNGSIAGVDPSLEPLNRILLPGEDDEGEASFSADAAPDNLAFVQDNDDGWIWIERLREESRRQGVAAASKYDVGYHGLALILQLAMSGYSRDFIFSFLLFGGRIRQEVKDDDGNVILEALVILSGSPDDWIDLLGEPTDGDESTEERATDPVRWNAEISGTTKNWNSADDTVDYVGSVTITRDPDTDEMEGDFYVVSTALQTRGGCTFSDTNQSTREFGQSLGQFDSLPNVYVIPGGVTRTHEIFDCDAGYEHFKSTYVVADIMHVELTLTDEGIAGHWLVKDGGVIDFLLVPGD